MEPQVKNNKAKTTGRANPLGKKNYYKNIERSRGYKLQ